MATRTSSKNSQFQVNLEGIKLSQDAEIRIERGIQALILQELAGYKPNPEGPDEPRLPYPFGSGAVIVIPIKWPGYWLKLLNEDELKGIEKVIDLKTIGR